MGSYSTGPLPVLNMALLLSHLIVKVVKRHSNLDGTRRIPTQPYQMQNGSVLNGSKRGLKRDAPNLAPPNTIIRCINEMEPVSSIEDAQRAVEEYQGNAEEFELPISEDLLDPIGINMSIITDGILAKGWEPNGYVQKNGYRIYFYKGIV
jgi:hypothetical protein